MEIDGIWRETFTVDASMVDTNRAIRLTSICNFLQVIAGNHAHFRGLGFDDMIQNNQFWMMSRMRVEMDSFPKWRANITIHTWINNSKGPFSYRSFEIYEKGILIGSANTLWVAIDGTTRRPIRVSTSNFPIINGKNPKCGEAGKVNKFSINANSNFFYKIVYSDLDMVNHVNNVKYIEWILDSFPVVEENQKPYFIELNYLSETRQNDEVSLFFHKNRDNEYLHEIQLKEGNKPVLRAKICWK
ncbi:MAG: acyl-[acyl-carrier-protein] thioesterase [Saprospiraceae bacterium]